MTVYKPHEFAKLLGVTVKILQRQDNIDRLKAYCSPSNHIYYTGEHLMAIIHVFSCSLYSLRKYKSKIKTDKEVFSLGINEKNSSISQ